MAENESRILLHEDENVSRLSSVRRYVILEPMQLRDELEKKLKKLSSELRDLLFKELDLTKEETARSRLVKELENSGIRRKELLDSLTEIGAIPEDATDKHTDKEIADHTVSILRGETALMKGRTAKGEHMRGVDVLRISFRQIGGPKERDSWASRGEMEKAPLLVETSADLDNTTVRPYNLVTETVSRLVDESKNDQDQEILEATVKRAIEEEVLGPLVVQLKKVKKSGKPFEDAVKELAKWLAEDPHFTTHFGKVSKSQSTGILSVYNIHELTIYVPHPGKAREFSELSEGATRLLRELWEAKGIKREKEHDRLVWADMFTGSRLAPLYYPKNKQKQNAEKSLIKEIQQDREEDLRIEAENSPPAYATKTERGADEWKDLIDSKHLVNDKVVKVGELGHYIEDYITADGKSLSKGKPLDWDELVENIKIQMERRKDALSLRAVRTCLSVREAVKNVKCNDCGSPKGTPCKDEDGFTFWQDSETYNNKKYGNRIIRFKVHKSRLKGYTGLTRTGGGAINDALKDGVRYNKSRLQSVMAKCEPVKLVSGTILRQVTVKEGTSKKHILESSVASSAVWDPDPDKTNPSQNNGWWPSVHIDQTPSDMRKIAGAMRISSYHFAVLRCGEGKALGLISCDDLESLADRLG